jgi:hypothetical protein
MVMAFSNPLFQSLLAGLLSYLDLDDSITVDSTLNLLFIALSRIRHHSMYPGYSECTDDRFVIEAVQIYDRLLENEELDLSKYLVDGIKTFNALMEYSITPTYNHRLHREFLLFADHLLSIERYASQGDRLLKAFEMNQLSAYASPNEPDPDFTATVICYLHVLIKNGLVPAVELLNPAMEDISIGDLYRAYPDSLSQLMELMVYDPQWLENGFEKMAEFIAEQGETLPVSICKSLCVLAKKTSHGAPLLAALNALLA